MERSLDRNAVRRYGASLAFIALALLASRSITPSGASAPLVLLGAAVAVAHFGGRRPALAATLAAAIVNGFNVGQADLPRLAVESSMIVLLGGVLAFRVPHAPVANASSPTDDGARRPASASLDGSPPTATAAATPSSRSESMPAGTNGATEAADDGPAPPRVLVVHGNAVLRLALRSTLCGLGYLAKDAANLAHAAPILDATEFGAVVVDFGRIDDGALDAVERLRQSNRASVIVVLANSPSTDERELVLAAGADLILQKPIDTAGVAAKIRERLPLTEAAD